MPRLAVSAANGGMKKLLSSIMHPKLAHGVASVATTFGIHNSTQLY